MVVSFNKGCKQVSFPESRNGQKNLNLIHRPFLVSEGLDLKDATLRIQLILVFCTKAL